MIINKNQCLRFIKNRYQFSEKKSYHIGKRSTTSNNIIKGKRKFWRHESYQQSSYYYSSTSTSFNEISEINHKSKYFKILGYILGGSFLFGCYVETNNDKNLKDIISKLRSSNEETILEGLHSLKNEGLYSKFMVYSGDGYILDQLSDNDLIDISSSLMNIIVYGRSNDARYIALSYLYSLTQEFHGIRKYVGENYMNEIIQNTILIDNRKNMNNEWAISFGILMNILQNEQSIHLNDKDKSLIIKSLSLRNDLVSSMISKYIQYLSIKPSLIDDNDDDAKNDYNLMVENEKNLINLYNNYIISKNNYQIKKYDNSNGASIISVLLLSLFGGLYNDLRYTFKLRSKGNIPLIYIRMLSSNKKTYLQLLLLFSIDLIMRKVFMFSSNERMEFNINDIIKYENSNNNNISISKYFIHINNYLNSIMMGYNDNLKMSSTGPFIYNILFTVASLYSINRSGYLLFPFIVGFIYNHKEKIEPKLKLIQDELINKKLI